MTQTLKARRLITHDTILEFPVITIADGLITRIDFDPHLHAETDTLTAAFLDIHTHGALNHDVMTASPAGLHELQSFLAQHGVAHYLPTTVTASIDATLHALDNLAALIESAPSPNEATPIGIHLEGPFLSHAKRGVHNPDLLQPPTIELFDRFQTAARGHIKLVTVAPEPGAHLPLPFTLDPGPLPSPPDFIAHVTATGVRVSLGHSNATTAETLPAIAAGATSATHTFNAMRALDHREAGSILNVILDNPNLYAELIADGIHVNPTLVRLWLHAKQPHHAILVTDSMSATGMPDGPYTLAGEHVLVANNRAVLTASPTTLAGSILTLDQAVANLQRFTQAPLADAVQTASHTPAAMLGLPHLTAVATGQPANLNRFNAAGRLTHTYIRGQQIQP